MPDELDLDLLAKAMRESMTESEANTFMWRLFTFKTFARKVAERYRALAVARAVAVSVPPSHHDST